MIPSFVFSRTPTIHFGAGKFNGLDTIINRIGKKTLIVSDKHFFESSDKIEFQSAKKMGLLYIDAFTIQKNGISKALEKTKEYLKDKKIYLSLDIDVIDPSFAPGTSTPEPFGITPFDVLECIDAFSSQLVGSDIVEVCPPYDHGETSLLAAKLIRYIIESVSVKK